MQFKVNEIPYFLWLHYYREIEINQGWIQTDKINSEVRPVKLLHYLAIKYLALLPLFLLLPGGYNIYTYIGSLLALIFVAGYAYIRYKGSKAHTFFYLGIYLLLLLAGSYLFDLRAEARLAISFFFKYVIIYLVMFEAIRDVFFRTYTIYSVQAVRPPHSVFLLHHELKKNTSVFMLVIGIYTVIGVLSVVLGISEYREIQTWKAEVQKQLEQRISQARSKAPPVKEGVLSFEPYVYFDCKNHEGKIVKNRAFEHSIDVEVKRISQGSEIEIRFQTGTLECFLSQTAYNIQMVNKMNIVEYEHLQQRIMKDVRP